MSELGDFARKYGTDKAHFGYTEIYEKVLSGMRGEIKSVLEIGIKEGASLRMWKEYFPNAAIVGVDIDVASLIEERRICSFVFDQESSVSGYNSMIQILSPMSPFDVIIDDGSHWHKHILKSFDHFWEVLRPGGFYFIEDVANEEISLKRGDTWGSIKPDFSDAVIKIFERKKETDPNIDIYYARVPPLTNLATSDFIVIKKPLEAPV
jgi:SAM-dependent methyltransferase